jgi:hypothetical protein
MCLCKTPNYLEQWSFKIPSLADTISTDAGRPIGTAGVFCSGRRAKLATGRTYVLYCTCTSGLQYQLLYEQVGLPVQVPAVRSVWFFSATTSNEREGTRDTCMTRSMTR